MITPAHAHMMARYNRWQNRSLYAAVVTLSDAQRREDKGAFFGSLHKTLAHILWADRVWMSRFAQRMCASVVCREPKKAPLSSRRCASESVSAAA